jgi:uncharacterized membrane protein YedE/YeeE
MAVEIAQDINWLAGLGGGALIGAAATLLFWLNGRIAGISGILAGTLAVPATAGGERLWRMLFIAGLIAGGAAYMLLASAPLAAANDTPSVTMTMAGLLVGLGTRIGNGCTSGHGVCGIARGSLRSLAATVTFIATGMLTVFVLRQVTG